MREYLHLLPFFSWIPMAMLAGARTAQRGRAPFLWTLCGITFVLCVYMLYLDFVWSKHVVAPIRVDLLLMVPLTTATFIGVGIWGLARTPVLGKFASLLLLGMSLPVLADFEIGMRKINADMERFNQRGTLIFEAQFRNPRTFRAFFGSINTAADPRAGHFRAEGPRSLASRAIINDRGHLWVMVPCAFDPRSDCVFWEAELGSGPMPAVVTATSLTSQPDRIAISGWTPDRFTLRVGALRESTLVRRPVPYRGTGSAPEAVGFVGSFAQTRLDRRYMELVQVWLWQSGDRWLAYYERRNAACGSRSDFISPSAFAGKALGDQVFFDPADGGQAIETFHITAPAAGADRVEGEIVYSGRPLRQISLTREPVLRSPILEIAPLADLTATTEWLKTVTMGYSQSWTPACPAAAAGP